MRPPLHLGVVAIEKVAFWLPSITVANFTYLSKVFGHLQNVLFIILKVLFFNETNLSNSLVFIYSTKYNSSWATLNKNETKNQNSSWKFSFIKMTLLGRYHCITDSRHSFHQRLKVDWKWFCSAFLLEFLEVSCTWNFFSSDFFLVNFIPHQFHRI